MYTYIYIYIYPHGSQGEKWEVPLKIRLLGTTFWCGLSHQQAATAQMHLVEKNIAECRPRRRSTSPFPDARSRDRGRRGSRGGRQRGLRAGRGLRHFVIGQGGPEVVASQRSAA